MVEKTSDAMLFLLLNEALASLDSYDDLDSEDAVPAITKALGCLDDMHARLGNYVGLVFTRAVRSRIETIRGGLRIGDRNAAREGLRELAEGLEG
jgi:hypothetical protein